MIYAAQVFCWLLLLLSLCYLVGLCCMSLMFGIDVMVVAYLVNVT